MRLAAFDPRVRTLNGLAAAFSNRQRYLSALACMECQAKQMAGLRGLARLRGITFADGNWNRLSGFRGITFADGNWNRLSAFGRLGQGDIEFEPVTPIDTTSFPISGDLIPPTPSADTSVPFLPGWQMPTPSAAALTPSTYDPTTGLVPPSSLPASSSPGQPSLTAAQVAAQIQAARTLLPAAPAQIVQPGTILGVPPSTYLYWAGLGLLGVVVLSGLGKKR
jgi:hypothetical protein